MTIDLTFSSRSLLIQVVQLLNVIVNTCTVRTIVDVYRFKQMALCSCTNRFIWMKGEFKKIKHNTEQELSFNGMLNWGQYQESQKSKLIFFQCFTPKLDFKGGKDVITSYIHVKYSCMMHDIYVLYQLQN